MARKKKVPEVQPLSAMLEQMQPELETHQDEIAQHHDDKVNAYIAKAEEGGVAAVKRPF